MFPKKSSKAVNAAHVALFAAACVSASAMAQSCEKLARAIIGKGRGKDAYADGVRDLSALEAASQDGNKHTVRRYTAEALAILAQTGRKATIPTVARERTEKAQGARKSLGIAKRGVKTKKKAKPAKVAKLPEFDTAYRAMLRLAAGRASLISWAKLEGYDMILSPRVVTAQSSAPSDAKPTPKATAALVAKSAKAAKAQSKANGAQH